MNDKATCGRRHFISLCYALTGAVKVRKISLVWRSVFFTDTVIAEIIFVHTMEKAKLLAYTQQNFLPIAAF
jgi:hypothetical protein